MPKHRHNDLGVQVRLCLNCGKPLVVLSGDSKVYCSPTCRQRFHDKLRRRRKREKNPEWARAELQRLLRWKQERKMNEAQRCIGAALQPPARGEEK